MLAAADATAGEQSVVTAGGGSRSGRHPAVDTASPPRIELDRARHDSGRRCCWGPHRDVPAAAAAPNLAGEAPVITGLFG
jgi:hypothetical protein